MFRFKHCPNGNTINVVHGAVVPIMGRTTVSRKLETPPKEVRASLFEKFIFSTNAPMPCNRVRIAATYHAYF